MDPNTPSSKPRDAHTVEAILKSMGVESYDPRVVNQLLELLYRYVSSVLSDSRDFSEHADKPAIDLDDVRFAIRSKCASAFTQPPPRDVTMRLAAERNSIPLPAVDQRPGIALPPRDFQLTGQNYRVLVADDRTPSRTPQSSPKRPRLNLSTTKEQPAGAKTPEKSPGRKSPASAKVSIPRSVQSPTKMTLTNPVKAKVPDGTVPPLPGRPSETGPGSAASPIVIDAPEPTPIGQQGASPSVKVATPTMGTETTPTMPEGKGAASSTPDVIMLDTGPSDSAMKLVTPTPAQAAPAAPAATLTKTPTTPLQPGPGS